MEAEYLFQQQLNDLCFLAPLASLRRLESLLDAHGTLAAIPVGEWHTRRDWFGREVVQLDAWYRAIERVNSPDDKEVAELRQLACGALADCPITPHFYDAAGRHFFSGTERDRPIRFTLGQLQKLADFALTPFLFIDLQAFAQIRVPFMGQLLPEMGIRIPLVRERRDGPLLVYNQETHAYEPLTVEPTPDGGGLHDLAAARTQKGPLSLPAYQDLARWRKVRLEEKSKHRTLGFPCIARAPSFGRGMILGPPGSPSYVPYMAGLYKLMLCTLGLDELHQPLHREHFLYPAHQSLRAVHNAEPEWNCWSERFLRSECFLQIALADLFRAEPQLCERAQAVCDFSKISSWRSYSRFMNAVAAGKIYKDRHGRNPYSLSKVAPYLPGVEQMLALSMTGQVRLLWYGTLNESAFHRYTGPRIPFYLAPFMGMFTWTFADFRAGAFRRQRVQGRLLSFIDVWQEIRERLLRLPRRHWFSFDHHGWVVSFDAALIDAQRQAMSRTAAACPNLRERLALLEAIGCTGIDASHSRAFNSFYKRMRG